MNPKDTYFQRPLFSPTRDFYSLALSIHSHLLYAFDGQTLNVRKAKMVAWRKDANKQKRQANKNLKMQGVKLNRSRSANANLRLASEEMKTTSMAARWRHVLLTLSLSALLILVLSVHAVSFLN